MNNRLFVVGNGFDKAHGYCTSYSDFVQYGECKYLKEFQYFSEKYICKEMESGVNWYDFENIMNAITLSWFQKLNDAELEEDDSERTEILRDIKKINRVYHDIGLCLQKYLAEATSANQEFKLDTIRKYISPGTNILSFNYTNVAERYSQNVHYIHGSLKEESIVFGYPERDEPDVIEEIATIYSKGKLREMLNFTRFLKQKGIDLEDKEGKKLVRKMNLQIQSLFSLRGEYDSEPDYDSLPKVIQEYGTRYNYATAPIDFGIDLRQMKELIIMGHSLRADEDVFNSIIDEAKQLQNVMMFTYEGECEGDLEKKINYFRRNKIQVDTCYYR